MKKLTPTQILLAEIAIIVLSLCIAIYLIKSWLDEQDEKDKKDEDAVISLGNTTAGAVTNDILFEYVKGIPVASRPAVLKALHALPLSDIATTIHDADGNLDDDEEAVYSAIARLKTKVAYAFFCDYFKTLYKQSLFTFLHSFLDNEELANVNTIVEKLKPY